MKRPAANLAADARQRLRAGGGLETVREDAPVRLHPHDLPGAKRETQKVEVDVRGVAAPVHILAVDDLRLLWDAAPACRPPSGRPPRPTVPAPPRRSCSDKWHRPHTARTGHEERFSPSTCRTRSAGTGSSEAG